MRCVVMHFLGGGVAYILLFWLKPEAKTWFNYIKKFAFDKEVFKGASRNGKSISKTYNGDIEVLMKNVLVPNTEYNR